MIELPMVRLHKVSRYLILLAVCMSAPAAIFAQEILTPLEYFDRVSDNYADIDDYVAEMSWLDESGSMNGTLYFKQPNFIRIDFANPEELILVSNGETFMIYVPAVDVVLQQELRQVPGETPGDLATPDGLAIMRRNFDIAYLEGPEPVPLDEESDVLVTQLRLDRKQVTEGFREIVLSVDESGFIRRIVGTQVDYEEVRLDLTNIEINQSIPESRFDYTPEADASVLENFLFRPEE